MILSICIPTFNRINQLENCLNSILIAKNNCPKFAFEVCVSDNASDQDVIKIIKKYKNNLKINFNRNLKNLGFAKNAIKAVSMAKGTFSWMIGDDDLITPDSLSTLNKIISNNLDKDYFYINSYYLNSEYLKNFKSPFDTNNVNYKNLESISKIKQDKVVSFWEVIDPDISWAFLIGIFVSIFRTKDWLLQSKKLDEKKISDTGVWSNFENTCLNAILISEICKNSKAYICSKPLSINLIGEREWGEMYEFIEIVRIPELLDFYRSKGLSNKKYLACKNYALRNFGNYFLKILIGGKKKGRNLINFKKHFLKNLIFPNVYFSFFKAIWRKLF